jgi:hypothetical protein
VFSPEPRKPTGVLSEVKGKTLPEPSQSLRLELARLRELVADLRSVGHIGSALVLEETVAELEAALAKLTSATGKANNDGPASPDARP